MARKRMIDPNFWRDEKIGELPFVDRLIFIGLWTCAEDNGAGRANPKLLKADILPYDDAFRLSDFIKSLERLASLKLITLYEVNGQKYFYVNNFAKHQTISRPTPTNVPLPEEVREIVREEVENDEKTSEKTDSMSTHGVFNEYSMSTHGVFTPKKEIEKEEEKENKYISLSAPVRVIEDNLLPDFEEFKKNHPNVQIDTCNIGGYDFTFLSQKIKDTPYLQQMTSLSWLLKQYPRIRAGYYDKHQKPKEEKKGTGHFSGERKLSKEGYAKLVSSVDDIEI
ncbi:MAG: hypothetical protein IJ981_03235 [Clostridia bacterium]|nr:hypothetical protein [Clostridia bacterium]